MRWWRPEDGENGCYWYLESYLKKELKDYESDYKNSRSDNKGLAIDNELSKIRKVVI